MSAVVHSFLAGVAGALLPELKRQFQLRDTGKAVAKYYFWRSGLFMLASGLIAAGLPGHLDPVAAAYVGMATPPLVGAGVKWPKWSGAVIDGVEGEEEVVVDDIRPGVDFVDFDGGAVGGGRWSTFFKAL